ncbi:MAG TPA: class I SAM-dependent methyltransferase [Aquihabitans sp.]|jgi:ubiquinone/menaquinone biosynthesis C-methylase UbiE|nr:class I SAM-dependent methyltransferase [Aquihabitans sp.]
MADERPEPDPKQVISGAFSAASSSYDEVVDFFGPFGRALATAADLQTGERVLDVACGRGASLYPALAAVGDAGSVCGIDLSSGMVERLVTDLRARGASNAEVRVGDAEALELPDGAFDAALAGFVVFFAPDPPAMLSELHRVVRPGGRVALSIFDGPPGFPFMAEVTEELVGPPSHRPSDEYNKASVLEPALVRAGFEQPTGRDVVERFRFADADQVERWLRSHAGRILLDSLDDLQLERFRGLLAERLEAHRVDGGFELVQRARVVVARRPD